MAKLEEENKSGLSEEIDHLRSITELLRVVGWACPVFTFLNLSVISLGTPLQLRPDAIVICSMLALACALLCVVCFESLRKKGDAIFAEVSDELQWRIRPVKKSRIDINGKKALEHWSKDRPTLKVRIVLRSFSKASDLPIIPGQFGPAVYSGINVLISLIYLSISFNYLLRY